MRILLTNNHLVNIGGTETWIRTMAHELRAQGHEVDIYTLETGMFSDLLKAENFKIYTHYPDLEDNYDGILCNHTTTFYNLKLRGLKAPIIFTSHSFFIDIEQPPAEAYEVVSVTEEIGKGKIIRNGIDVLKFDCKKPINKKLTNILYLTHPWNKEGNELVIEACKEYNLTLITTEIIEMDTLINENDLVITLGRGILESLACGRNVISGDHRHGWMTGFVGGGMITEDNFDDLKTHALSGRNKPIYFTAETLKKELLKYDPARNLRNKMVSEYNIMRQAQKYVELIKAYE